MAAFSCRNCAISSRKMVPISSLTITATSCSPSSPPSCGASSFVARKPVRTAKNTNAKGHQDHGHNLTGYGNWHVVTITHGGHGDKGPPKGIGTSSYVGPRRPSFDLENDKAGNGDQDNGNQERYQQRTLSPGCSGFLDNFTASSAPQMIHNTDRPVSIEQSAR